MSTQSYEQAVTATRGVLARLTPEQLDADTPCQSWKVRDVVNHVIGAQWFFAGAPEKAPADAAAGDFLASFDESTAGTLSVFSAPGAATQIFHLPFGDMPGAAVMGLAATDTFTHGWDVAKATGQSTDLDPSLAERLLALSQDIQDDFRGDDGAAPFGPEKQAPVDASAADRLAAFLGRDV